MVPIFVNLKDFAEVDEQPGLLAYITTFIQASSLSLNQENANIKQLLISGRMLILLDALDEVKDALPHFSNLQL